MDWEWYNRVLRPQMEERAQEMMAEWFADLPVEDVEVIDD